MIKSYILNKYLSKEFFKVLLNMTFSFFCLGFILKILEEINFFKDFDVSEEAFLRQIENPRSLGGEATQALFNDFMNEFVF